TATSTATMSATASGTTTATLTPTASATETTVPPPPVSNMVYLPLVQRNAQALAVLHIEPSLRKIDTGQQSYVDLRLDRVAGVTAITLTLAYDPAVITPIDAHTARPGVQIERGDFPDKYISEVTLNEVDLAQGLVRYAVTVSPGMSVVGGGVVARLDFTGIAEGYTKLQWATVEVDGLAGAIIYVPGEVYVAGPTVTVTSTPSATSTSTASGTTTPTRTPSVTPTRTPTLSPTITMTPSRTGTPTVTQTPSSTSTPTRTGTPTLSPTITLTPSHTGTPTITPTPSSTSTPTRTGTPTLSPTITLTPVYTWTPTRTSTPVATATVTPGQCRELLANGDFEINTGWIFGETPRPGRYVRSPVYSGSQAVQLGILPPTADIQSYSSVRQFVRLPAGITSAKLSFWYWPATADTSVDFQEVWLLDPVSLFPLPSPDAKIMKLLSNDRRWKPVVEDITAFAGQSFYLYFNAFNDGDGRVTSMAVDAVSLTVCGP
ncbi:MAG: hypothetical protein HY326_00640, partial [Chloroflexi bacterium]|nr:hypothetical protein [Chloroflexota bacterium]